MMRIVRPLVFVLFAACGPVSWAGEAMTPIAWLQKISDATRTLNYSGTFIFQQGGRVETERILHRVDGDEQMEKLESLDGPARELIRVGDQVICYTSGAKVPKVERRAAARFFPRILPRDTAAIADAYTVRFGEPARITGRDCVALVLEPRDALRYGHRLWAEADSGLLLKAVMVGEMGQPITQFTFTQVSIGQPPERSEFRPTLLGGTIRAHEVQEGPGAMPSDEPWTFRPLPSGFVKTREMKRNFPGHAHPVFHVVFSDGLATVSVFVEQAGSAEPAPGMSVQGPINLYSTRVGDYLVTALGEVPPAMVKSAAQSLVVKTGTPP